MSALNFLLTFNNITFNKDNANNNIIFNADLRFCVIQNLLQPQIVVNNVK